MERKYYYTDGNVQFGPFSYNDLDNEKVTPETLFWFQGLDGWTKGKNIPELQPIFNLRPPVQSNYSSNYTPPPPPNYKIKQTTSNQTTDSFRVRNIVSVVVVIAVIYFFFFRDDNEKYGGSEQVVNQYASSFVGQLAKKIAPITGNNPTYVVDGWSYDEGIYTINLQGMWYEKSTPFSDDECQVNYGVKLTVNEKGDKILGQTITGKNDCARNHEFVGDLIDIGISALGE